jgi:hypothetical protein
VRATLTVSQEAAMRERPHPHRTPIIETLPDPVIPPHIETPVIETRDLEQVASDHARASSRGVKLTPTMDTAMQTTVIDDRHELTAGEEDALRELEQIEKSLRGHLPG